MRCQTMLRFYALLMLCVTVLASSAVTKRDTLHTHAGDAVIIDYDITLDNGQAVINFIDASVSLGQQNRSYRSYQDNKSLKVLFIDGWNFEQGYKVETEKGRRIKVKPFTTPAGWSYVKEGSGTSHIFPVNNTGRSRLTFEGGQNKIALKVPIYLAVYDHKDAKKLIRKASTTYKVFAECPPMTVEMSVKPAKKTDGGGAAAAAARAASGGTRRVEVPEYEDVVIESDDDVVSLGTDQIDREARALMNRIESQMASCSTEEDYNQLEIDMHNLDKYWQGASPAVKSEIDDLKSRFNSGRGAAQAAAAQAAAAAQDSINNQAEQAAQEQEDQNRKDKWWMFIIAVVLGVLGFGGSQVAQHVRNNKNQQSMMNMQQSVVRRAESEAKRRAQSYARNKTHQAVGQAKQKGRQAVRSNVKKLGDNVKGRQSEDKGIEASRKANDTQRQAGAANRPYNAARKPGRGPKKNKDGDISI